MKPSIPAAVAAAACLLLSACATKQASSQAQRGMDISQLPGPPSAMPELQVAPRQLSQPKAAGEVGREDNREAIRGLRPGVAGGERSALPPPQQTYAPKLPAFEPKPVPDEQKPALTLPSL